MTKAPKDKIETDESMRRMDQALKAAMKMPPRKHKDEPKRRTGKGQAK